MDSPRSGVMEMEQLSTRTVFCQLLLRCLAEFWILVHYVIDILIDLCFGLFYNDSKRQHIPTVKENNSLVMESAVSLAERIRNKEVSAVEVVQGFVDRIREVNTILNAMVDERFEDALKEAKAVDELLASGSKSIDLIRQQKPFLGVPFTTKDSTAVKGLRHTLGLISRRDIRATEDADVVLLMKDAGAILLAVTNIPEVNMWVESRNNVYGQTANPYNTTKTVGGSSGGEASLIAASGSPLGLGTDIGGSIRLPAFCCGIFGHKPTTGLTPLKGLTRRTGLEEHTMVSAGPMCRYAQDLAPFLRVLVGANASKLQLDLEVNLSNVQFLYMEESGDLRTSSVSIDMQQAVRRAVNHFRGISKQPINKVNLSSMKYSYRLWRYWMTKEPANFAKELANREGAVSVFHELPKKLFCRSDFTLAALVRLLDAKLPQENAEWAEETTRKLKANIEERLGENGVLLFPSHPISAGYHYSSFLRPFNFSYFGIFNVLNLPVTQVPMGLNKDGMPIGIQVVAGPYNDHLCFAVAKDLQKSFGGWVPPFVI